MMSVPVGEEHPLQGHISLPWAEDGPVSRSQIQKGQRGSCPAGGCAGWKGLQGQQGKGLSSGKPQERAPARTGACWRGGKSTCTTFGSDDHQMKGVDV